MKRVLRRQYEALLAGLAAAGSVSSGLAPRPASDGTLHLTDHLTNLLTLPPRCSTRRWTASTCCICRSTWAAETAIRPDFDPMFADQHIAAAMSVPLPTSPQTIIDSKPYATHMQNQILGPLGITWNVLGASEFEHRQAGEVPYFTAAPSLYAKYNGSLPGTSALMARRFDCLEWVVLFNQRDDPSGLGNGAIDPALHTAADAVTNWPSGDLFPSYSLPSRYAHRVFLPLTRR